MPYRQIPSYNWLRVFEAAARYESFARAADHLAMSAPSVSQQIKALETHLRQQLFQRGAHSVRLTDAGAAFLPIVQQSLRSIETTAAALFGNPEQQPLSVLGSLMFVCSWLSPRLNDFQQHNPNVHLQISTADNEAEFRRADKDLLITFGGGPKFNRDSDFLFGETLYPVAIPSIAAQVADIDDLMNFHLIEIGTHRNSWYQVLSQVGHLRIDNARLSFADNTLVAMSMASSGLGIALARAPASDYICELFGLVPCLDDFGLASPHAYYLTYPGLSELSKAGQSFREWLLDSVANKTK